MVDYPATLNFVIDGSTVDLNVDIGDSQIEVQRVRLKGVQTENIMKQYRTSFKGSAGVMARFEVLEWFANNSEVLTLSADIVDICGRVLGSIFAFDEPESLNDYMKGKLHQNENWEILKQEELKNDWFAGEAVTVPGGDLLPIFHTWGKNVYLGYRSKCL